jgi:uncharacterized membrane protein
MKNAVYIRQKKKNPKLSYRVQNLNCVCEGGERERERESSNYDSIKNSSLGL